MKKSLLLIAIVIALSGCSTAGMFENRISCTVAKDKAFVVSEYAKIGIASTIVDKDAIILCGNSLPVPVTK